MSVAYLTRRVTFAAAHRYSRPEWDAARNAAVFGACSHPNFHGHSYVWHVTVCGANYSPSGFCVDLVVLDEIRQREVRERFDHRNLNLDIPELADGREIPTGENLARMIYQRVQAGLGSNN